MKIKIWFAFILAISVVSNAVALPLIYQLNNLTSRHKFWRFDGNSSWTEISVSRQGSPSFYQPNIFTFQDKYAITEDNLLPTSSNVQLPTVVGSPSCGGDGEQRNIDVSGGTKNFHFKLFSGSGVLLVDYNVSLTPGRYQYTWPPAAAEFNGDYFVTFQLGGQTFANEFGVCVLRGP